MKQYSGPVHQTKNDYMAKQVAKQNSVSLDKKDLEILKYLQQNARMTVREIAEQVHLSTTPVHETMEAMQKMLDEGKVKAIGVCNYNGAQLAEAEQTVRLASDQVPYSMLKRKIETDVVPYAQQHNLSIIAYSPMERGLLTGKYNSSYQLHEDDHRNSYFQQFDMDKVAKLTDHLAEMAAGYHATTAQLALAWVFHQPKVAAALAGARNARQATENAKAMQLRLSEPDLQQIEKWLAE